MFIVDYNYSNPFTVISITNLERIIMIIVIIIIIIIIPLEKSLPPLTADIHLIPLVVLVLVILVLV